MQDEIILELAGLTPTQCTIADFLFLADSEEDMQSIYDTFGRSEVEVIKQLMLAAALDDVEDVSTASAILQSYTL